MDDTAPDTLVISGDISALLGADDLHEDLKPYLGEVEGLGTVLRHPLVYSVPHAPVLNRHANGMLLQKRAVVDQALSEANWPLYLGMHETPYRINAFEDIAHLMGAEDYWSLLVDVWIETETITVMMDRWLALWQAEMADRHLAMTAQQRASLAAMPETLTLYRGVGHEDAVAGMSWSVRRSKAIWFAQRYSKSLGHVPHLATGTARRADVLAFLTQRNESEIVIDPDDVEVREIVAL